MPLFEYSCRLCDKQFTFLSGVVAQNDDARCPRCNSRDLQKLMSRFRRGRSDDERVESIAEKMEMRDWDDAKTARQFAREMGREIEDETGESFGDELESLVNDELESDGLESDERSSNSSSASNRDDGTIY